MSTVLLIGKTGQVGWELQRALAPLGSVVAVDRTQMNLTVPESVRQVIRQTGPEIIVNAAGYTAVDMAEAEPELAMQVNAIAPEVMADEARRSNALLVHYSTDYVYDGHKGTPYVEDDAPNPLNTYGRSKLAGEQAIIAAGCAYLILRTSWIYSARGTNFVLTMLKLARERTEIAVVDDQIGSPTWARILADATATVLRRHDHAKRNRGIYHLSAGGYPSRFDFACRIFEIARACVEPGDAWASIKETTTENYPLPAVRPLHVATSKEKLKSVFGVEMPAWDKQLESFLQSILRKPAAQG